MIPCDPSQWNPYGPGRLQLLYGCPAGGQPQLCLVLLLVFRAFFFDSIDTGRQVSACTGTLCGKGEMAKVVCPNFVSLEMVVFGFPAHLKLEKQSCPMANPYNVSFYCGVSVHPLVT